MPVIFIIVLLACIILAFSLKKNNKKGKSNTYTSVANDEKSKAIRASEYLNKPINVMDDDKEKRDAEYEIVKKEHDRLINSIHVPEIISPCDVELTPTEKVFLWYINGKPTNKPNIAVYWFIEYGVHDYQACIQKLFDGGYLTTASPKDSLSKLTIQQLGNILDDYALPKTGKKVDMVQRIIDTIPEDAINSIYKDFLRFSYTMKGHQTVNNAYPIIYFHQHKSHIPEGFTLDDVDYAVKRFPHLSPDEILILLPQIYKGQEETVILRRRMFPSKS